jgi:hypothetical protein
MPEVVHPYVEGLCRLLCRHAGVDPDERIYHPSIDEPPGPMWRLHVAGVLLVLEGLYEYEPMSRSFLAPILGPEKVVDDEVDFGSD